MVSPLRVLIVDDDPDHADILAEFVRECGHEATVARNAAEGLGHATAAAFELILVDFLLPDQTGDALVRQLRAGGVTCRIIATTGFGTKQARESVERSGVDAFLLKPFSLAKIKFELDQLARTV